MIKQLGKGLVLVFVWVLCMITKMVINNELLTIYIIKCRRGTLFKHKMNDTEFFFQEFFFSLFYFTVLPVKITVTQSRSKCSNSVIFESSPSLFLVKYILGKNRSVKVALTLVRYCFSIFNPSFRLFFFSTSNQSS